LAGVSEKHPSLQISGPLHTCYQLPESLRGAAITIPAGVKIDAWAWRHIVFADLRFDDGRAAPTRRPATADRARVASRKGAFVIVASPDQVRREPLVLLPAGGGAWQIVPEADVTWEADAPEREARPDGPRG
jgi:hypothetical protein